MSPFSEPIFNKQGEFSLSWSVMLRTVEDGGLRCAHRANGPPRFSPHLRRAWRYALAVD
jgi:hypothetical protein